MPAFITTFWFLGGMKKGARREGGEKGATQQGKINFWDEYWCILFCIYTAMLLLLLLSRFSRVRFCATP